MPDSDSESSLSEAYDPDDDVGRGPAGRLFAGGLFGTPAKAITGGREETPMKPFPEAPMEESERMHNSKALQMLGIVTSDPTESTRASSMFRSYMPTFCGGEAVAAWLENYADALGLVHAPQAFSLMVNTTFAITGPKAYVEIQPNWHVKGSPFTVIDGDPGVGKSTLSNAAVNAINCVNETNKLLFGSDEFKARMRPIIALAVRAALRDKVQDVLTKQLVKSEANREMKTLDLKSVAASDAERSFLEKIGDYFTMTRFRDECKRDRAGAAEARCAASPDAERELDEADASVAMLRERRLRKDAVAAVEASMPTERKRNDPPVKKYEMPAYVKEVEHFLKHVKQIVDKQMEAVGTVDFTDRSLTLGTWEKMLQRLVVTPTAILVCDELSRFIGTFNTYHGNEGLDEAILCEIFTAKRMGSDTISRGRQVIEFPQLSCLVTGTTSALSGWLEKATEAGATGLHERFDYAHIPLKQKMTITQEQRNIDKWMQQHTAGLAAHVDAQNAGTTNSASVLGDGSAFGRISTPGRRRRRRRSAGLGSGGTRATRRLSQSTQGSADTWGFGMSPGGGAGAEAETLSMSGGARQRVFDAHTHHDARRKVGGGASAMHDG